MPAGAILVADRQTIQLNPQGVRAAAADPLGEETRHALIRLLARAGQREAAREQYRELERLLDREWGEAPASATRELIDAIEREPGRAHPEGIETRSEPAAEDGGRAIPLRSAARQPDPPPSPHPEEPLPAGTLTFLLVELEGTDAAEAAREPLRSLFRGYGGHEVPLTPGWVVMAFGRASEAVAAAVAGMQALIAPPSLPGRMALDTGEIAAGALPQHSPASVHAARLLLAAHPGQILLSGNSAALLRRGLAPGVRLADRGRYQLRAGAPPEHLFQVEAPELPRGEFPPPKATPAHPGNLPLPLTRFFGRETELGRLRELLLGERRRLVTLTGPGGSGKSRLALELTAGLRDEFHGAPWFAPLADLSEPGLIPDKESLALFHQHGDRSAAAHVLSIFSSSNTLVEQGGFMNLPALQRICDGLCREAGNEVALAFVLIKQGNTAWAAGDNDPAVALMEEALALYRRFGDRQGIAFAVGELGYVRTWQAEYQQAEVLLSEMLELSRQMEDRSNTAHALFHLGNLARLRGDYVRAVDLLEESVALRREGQQRPGICVSLGALAQALVCQGNYPRAHRLLEEALTLVDEAKGGGGSAMLVGRLAAVLALEGDEAAARELFEQSLARAREGKDRRSAAAALHGLAQLAIGHGESGAARALFAESLTIRRDLDDLSGAADCLDGLAAAAAAAGRRATAARWFGAAAAARERIGAVLPPPDRTEVDRGLAAVRAALGEAAFGAAWDSGQATTLEQAIAEALEEMPLSG